jgi:hypothetical protein
LGRVLPAGLIGRERRESGRKQTVTLTRHASGMDTDADYLLTVVWMKAYRADPDAAVMIAEQFYVGRIEREQTIESLLLVGDKNTRRNVAQEQGCPSLLNRSNKNKQFALFDYAISTHAFGNRCRNGGERLIT